MHISLRLKTLSSFDYRTLAAATAAVNGSLPHLRAMVQLAGMKNEETRVLPVFYHHLDPAKIPSEDAMDVEFLATNTLESITLALLCLEGLSNIYPFPPGADIDLWERVWPWARFFDSHGSRIPDVLSEDIIRARVLAVIASMEVTCSKMASTPEIGVLAAQAWSSYFRDPNYSTEKAIRRLTIFLAMRAEYGLNPFIEGAGSVDALAILVVKLVDYLLEWPLGPVAMTGNLSGVLIFCSRSKDHAWLSALQSHKFMRAMITVLLCAERFIDIPGKKGLFAELHEHAWQGFCRVRTLDSGYTYVVEAIDAGFLRLIVSLAGRDISWLKNRLQAAFKFMLQPATVYYPVLAALERALLSIQQVTLAPTFMSCALYPDWEEFNNLVLDRLDAKREFDSGGHVACRACDNLKCGRIMKRTNFKRCAGCEYQYYCSKECQIKDWRTGHREACRHLRPPGWHLDELDGPPYLNGRDRAFLRFLVARDYERHKLHIFLTQIVRIRQHGESLVTVCDYRDGSFRPDVKPVYSEDEERDYFARCTRSGRRMHPTVVVFSNCRSDPQQWLVPIRSSSSTVHDSLFDISQDIVPGTDSVSDLHPDIHHAVTELVENVCPHIQEII
ncbi:MYND-type domain-containing protein [Mycena sanguinolenta]|uniref:MYND-type domain-containing protein n=1 Tax=Mycena sanguinolenta TaxID=230812 RepID=A0A8H6YMX8_9AGAR|nr:MYND-type domain-containing protein [Mycena sanguinolenta]